MAFADTIPEIGADPRDDEDSKDPRAVLAESLMESIRQSSLQTNEDPNAVVEQQLSQRSLGRRILADFLIGFQNSFSGTKTKDLRSQLVDREILRQTMKAKQEQRKQALLAPLVQLLGQVGRSEDVVAGQRGQFERTLAAEVGKGQRQEQKLAAEAPLREARTEAATAQAGLARTRTAQVQQQVEAGVPAQTFGSGDAAIFTSITENQKSKGTFGTPEGIRELTAINDQLEQAKKEGKTLKPRVFKSGVDINGQDVFTGIDPHTGQVLFGGDRTFTPKRLEQIQSNTEFVGNLRDVFNIVKNSDSVLTGRKFFLPTKLLEAFGAVSAEERAVIQAQTSALASKVRAFSGAQVTDRERVFLEGTLARLFLEQDKFLEATITSLIAAEVSGIRLRLSPGKAGRIDMTSVMKDLLDEFEATGKLNLPDSQTLFIIAAGRSGVEFTEQDLQDAGIDPNNMQIPDEFLFLGRPEE
jgi:hypothetical protein